MKDEEHSGTKYINSIKVPTTAVSAYESADGWKYFSDRISGYQQQVKSNRSLEAGENLVLMTVLGL